MRKPQKKWTRKEIDLCLSLQKAGHTPRQIAAFLERSYMSVDGYLRRERMELSRQYRRVADKDSKYLTHAVQKVHVPDFVLADRDRRANEYRSPSQILMGEPPPSQSALGRRI